MKQNSFASKLLALLLVCVLILSATACSTAKPESATTPTEQSQSEKAQEKENSKEVETSTEKENTQTAEFDPRSITEGVTLTIAVDDHLRIQDYKTNNITKMIEDALGVNLEFTTLASADYLEKMNIKVMSGDTLPDIIFGTNLAGYTDSWAKEGALLELSDYYADPNLAHYLHSYEEESGYDFASMMADGDGNVYGMPLLTDTLEDTWQKIWLYKPWLDAIGMEMPKTTEEYYEVCKAVVSQDMNGNGKADEIAFTGTGLMGWFTVLMSPYIYAGDSEYRVINNGEISFAYTTEEWKEGLKYIRRFFTEGLVPDSILTQDWNQWWGEMFADEVTDFSFVWFYYNGDQEQTEKYGRDYVYITALEGPTGQKQPYYAPNSANVGAVITTNCTNPEAAFLVLDYMCSEEIGITQRYGQRGVDWDYWEEAKVENKSDYKPTFDGFDLSIIVYDDSNFWGGTEPQNASYLQRGPEILQHDIYCGQAKLSSETPSAADVVMDNYYKSYSEVMSELDKTKYLPKITLTNAETEEIASIKATLATYINEAILAFLSGDKDIDRDWDAYIEELEKIGYQKVLDMYQAAYDRAYN